MKGLFCYDGPISCDEHGNYFGTVLNNQVFRRYFAIVDSLDIAIRVENGTPQNNKTSQITLENINIINVPNIASIKGLINRKEANQILESSMKNADIIFIRLPSFIGNVAVKLAEKLNKPYLIEMVGCPWDSLWNHSIKGKIIAPYMWSATKSNIKKAKYVVYVTNSFLQNRYPTKGKSVNCSNVELPQTDNAILEKRLNKIHKPKEKIVIGTAAALNVRYKGQQYIIEAISKLKNEGIHCEYQLVGWGDSSYLREKAEEFGVVDQVKFIGTLPHEQVFSWIDKIDIYAQPSKQEGLPRALIEAMNRGCPAIGASSGGIPELLEEEYVFSKGRKNIDEICKILKNYSTEKMKEQAKRNFSESKQYNKELIQKRRESLFFELMKNI
ncbi:glycosyl transferase [Peribacillus simplex]|uniref:Glycosyl transferase n=1 Tax=Peribacillus simplex TaxID=1478 RepID=A0A109MUB3_9BACI|nr:glycosyltransferase [Peribacillus simplex]KWW14058.1 glycosyl transferase [Peribacillus simplex]